MPFPFHIQFDIMVYQEDHSYDKSHCTYYLIICLKTIFTIRKKINKELAIKFSSLMILAS